MTYRKADPKLQEVKDVLLRLQRMDIQEDLAATREPAGRATRPSSPWTNPILIVSGIAGGLCVAAVIAVMYVAKVDRTAQPIEEKTGATFAETGPEPASRVELAQQFVMAGRVRAARALLLEERDEMSEDVALALARSYDPNLLKRVPSADSEPDRGEAERWYREWHAIAKEKGLVTDGVALERLIRSMR